MKKVISVAFVGVLATASLAVGAGAAFSESNDASSHAPGQVVRECFGDNYGQSGLAYGQAKVDPPHPVEPYGLPELLAAHGPNGAVSLCPPAPPTPPAPPAPVPAPAVVTPQVTG